MYHDYLERGDGSNESINQSSCTGFMNKFAKKKRRAPLNIICFTVCFRNTKPHIKLCL
jgi:hypothetical protein